jgi:polyisoprenoid-binding protein YceI
MSTHAADIVGTTHWRLDPARSSIEFQVPAAWGLSTVKGSFSRYHGTLDASAIELTIEADSIDTENERRDKHLRSVDFFDVERHPYVRFVSERVAVDGDRLEVRGRLHARGASMPLDIDATLRRAGDELEVEAVTLADHRRLGMTWNFMGMLRPPIELFVRGRLVRDA